jgi:hypothetical protein
VPRLYIHFPRQHTRRHASRDLSHWDIIISQEGLVSEGEFVLSVGFSSRDFVETATLTIV